MLRRGFCPDEDSKIVQRLRDTDLQLYSDYCGMRNCLREILPFMSMNIKYYTDHGINHSLRVIEVLDELIIDEVLEEMTSPELYLLLCGVWLHDIGMLLNYDPDTGRELEDKEIRKNHHELSKKFVMKNFPKLDIRDENRAEIIGDVCFFHRGQEDINKLDEGDYILNEKIRPRFIAALLRLADALDLHTSRAPDFIPENIMIMPIESQLNWRVYNLLDYARPEPEKKRIFIAARAKEEDLTLLKWKIRDIWEEFKSVQHIILSNNLIYRNVKYKLKGDKCSTDASTVGAEFTLLEAKLSYWGLRIKEHENKLEELKRKRENEEIKKDKYIVKTNIENLMAADLCFQAAVECESENEIDRASSYYEKAASFFDIGNNEMYFSVLFKKYCKLKSEQLKAKSHEKNRGNLEDTLIYHMKKRILPALDFIRTNSYALVSNFISLKILCRSCWTEERGEIRKAIMEISEKLPKEEKGVHENCCLCTARLISSLAILGKLDEVSKISSWLSKQNHEFKNEKNEEKRGEYRLKYRPKRLTEEKIPKQMSYVYTAETLEAFLDIGNKKVSKNVADVLLANKAKWLDTLERDELETKAAILYSLYRYIRTFESEERNSIIDEIWDELKNFLTDCEKETNEIDRMFALKGLLFWHELEEYEKKRKKENERLSDKFKERAEKIANGIVEHHVWAEDGSWGYNQHVTYYTILGLLAYWNYVLKEQDKPKST